MAKNPIVFALANPDPEIAPDAAMPLVKILATGRSDFPNQINNMLSYPGIFRGLLDVHARGVNEEVKLAAAEAIAHMVKSEELHEDYIIPSPFEKRVVHAVAHAVAEAARMTGLAER
jgi:malate dehydrogenase (oxaloacetate-decarboxylating)